MNNGCAAPLRKERLGSRQARLRGANGAGSGGRVWESGGFAFDWPHLAY